MNYEQITLETNLPTWEEIERYNNKEKYVGLELMFHIEDNLYFRISVQNEKVIFPDNPKVDNIIYMSLCAKNEFPIYNVSYTYCEEAYYVGIKEIIKHTTMLMNVLPKLQECLKNSLK